MGVGGDVQTRFLEREDNLRRIKPVHFTKDIPGVLDMLVDCSGADTEFSSNALRCQPSGNMRHALPLTLGQRLDGCAIFLQLGRQNVACHGATRPLYASATIAGRARRGGRSVS